MCTYGVSTHIWGNYYIIYYVCFIVYVLHACMDVITMDILTTRQTEISCIYIYYTIYLRYMIECNYVLYDTQHILYTTYAYA